MSKVQAARANTLDGFLDELPELPSEYFSYPVDDFFDNYVDGLQRFANSTSGEGQSESLQTTKDQGNAGLHGQTEGPLVSAMSLDLNIGADDTEPSNPVVSLPAKLDSPLLPAIPTAGLSMPIIGEAQPDFGPMKTEENSGVWGNEDRASRHKRTNGNSEYLVDDLAVESDDSDHKPAKSARATGKTKRNAKQQVQNKQAQQRYRERRKQRFAEMEHTIDGLNSEVQQMHAVQSLNSVLQAKKEELEAMLREKELELEQLRQQVQRGQNNNGADVEENSLEQRRWAEETNLKECQAKATAHVQALREFIDTHGLRNAKPTGEGVDPSVSQRLAEMVGRGCNTCQNAMRAEGVKVLRLMSRDVAHLSRIDCLRQCNKWTKVLQTLQLTDLQRDHLLLMRQNHLRNLRQVYEARQQLNMRAMSLMLPSTEKSSVRDLDGKMACMSLRGYSNCAKQSVELDEILNSIRENLRLEQKHVMEMNFITMHRLMSPLQAALFLVDAHPAYCDALALANILASQVEGSNLESRSGELQKLSSDGSHSGSPASSDNKSDTCRLLRGELDIQECG